MEFSSSAGTSHVIHISPAIRIYIQERRLEKLPPSLLVLKTHQVKGQEEADKTTQVTTEKSKKSRLCHVCGKLELQESRRCSRVSAVVTQSAPQLSTEVTTVLYRREFVNDLM